MKGLLVALRVYSAENLRGFKRLTDLLSPWNGGGFPFHPGFAVAGTPPPMLSLPTVSKPAEDKKSEGFLWGVPKGRRTIEKRLVRKFGLKDWVWKCYIPKYNIRICDTCGHHYEAKHLCRNCYETNKEETKMIRESVDGKFGHSPVDKDVIVLYESDKEKGLHAGTSSSASKNKLIIELPKERPNFFSPKLLQKSTVGINRKAKDVTTTDPIPIVHKSEN